jgi:hypothetical protein
MFKRRREEEPSWLEGVDVGRSGSRFSDQVALAIQSRSVGINTDGEGGDAEEIVCRALDGVPNEDISALGKQKAVDGSSGRGAEGWIAVLEFALSTGATGIIGGAAWEGLKAAGRQLRGLLDRLRKQDMQVMVSKGAAALVAIQHVLDQGEDGILDVESVSDPLAMAGRELTELSYVGVEPWLVSLVNEKRTHRFIVAVAPNGEVLGSMRFPLSEYEATMFGVLPPRD